MKYNLLVYGFIYFNKTKFEEGFVKRREELGVTHIGPVWEGLNIPAYKMINEVLKWNVSFIWYSQD